MIKRARIGVIGPPMPTCQPSMPCPRAEVTAIADSSPERLARGAEHFGITNHFQDYGAMLDRCDLDGVIVATPHNVHYVVAKGR